MTLIYPTINPTGYAADESRPSRLRVTPGICAGMTAVWCLKMGIGMNAANTKPGFEESRLSQFDYDANSRNAGKVVKDFLPTARLVIHDDGVWNENGSCGSKVITMEADNTYYFWGYPGHAIGAAKRDGLYYLFDPDRGLESFSTSAEFQRHVKTAYASHLEETWWLFSVQPDPSQRGVSYAIKVPEKAL